MAFPLLLLGFLKGMDFEGKPKSSSEEEEE